MKPFAIALLILAPLAATARADYHYQAVDYPGAAATVLFALNDRGESVGSFYTPAAHAMRFDGQQFHAIDPDGVIGTSPKSHAYSINNRDDIAGSYQDAGGVLHGFVFHAPSGQLDVLDHPSGNPTEAFGVNDLGEVIGVYYVGDETHAFRWRRGVYRAADLPGGSTTPFSINDRGEIVGEIVDVAGTLGHGFREACDGKVTRFDAPGAPANSTFFISINNRDQVLGAYQDAAGNFNNFVLDRGALQPFDLPSSFGATAVSAQTINDQGGIVGYYSDEQGVNHGFAAVRHDR
jgi:probable HAF family extracellular repeat protein